MIEAKYHAARPEDVGIDSERLEALYARVRRDIDAGLLPSAQVAIARNGKIAGMRSFGSVVQGGVERPATEESLYCIYSCTKAIVAAATWLLFEEGMLRLDEKVSDIVPEFATNGKEVVTVEQVLLHEGGFPRAPFAWSSWGDHAALLDAFSRWRLTWEPGTKYEYHATSAHWVLAEIIERRTGEDYRTFVRKRITEPMGLPELFIGLPPEYRDRFAEVVIVGEQIEPPGGYGEVTPDALLNVNKPGPQQAGAPGAGGVTSAVELAMFYQTLINRGTSPDGVRVLKPETIDFALEVRNRLPDANFNIPANRGLSIIIAGDDGNAFARGFGRVAGPRSFGHGGAGGQIAFGDPDSGISVGYVTNGHNDWMTVGRRITAIASLVAGCATV